MSLTIANTVGCRRSASEAYDYSQTAYPYQGLEEDARIRTKPFPHQAETIEWMVARENEAPVEGLTGGFLWHDMGLGKTFCALACSLLSGGRTLVICPAQLTHVWMSEAASHFTEIDSFLYYGPDRKDKFKAKLDSNLIVTAYTTVVSDVTDTDGPFHGVEFDRIILDESHYVKNSKTQAFQAVEKIQGRVKWLLSGTPLPNNVAEMFPYLKLLGYRYVKNVDNLSKKAFTNKFMSKTGYITMQKLLRQVAIRRTKEILDLPDRRLHDVQVVQSDEERAFYVALKDYSKGRLRRLMRNLRRVSYSGLGRQLQARLRMMNLQSVLSLIFHLRLACCDPQLVMDKIPRTRGLRIEDATRRLIEVKERFEEADCPVCHNDAATVRNSDCGHIACRSCWDKLVSLDPPICFECMSPTSVTHLYETPEGHDGETWEENETYNDASYRKRSSKTIAILERIQSELDRGEKVICVSQWTTYLDVLIHEFAERFPNVSYSVLTGAILPTKRQKIIAQFQEQGHDRVLFATLGSSAEGVTLTAASRMIIAEPYWNRARISQMSDRVHRIGQKQKVDIYCMFLENTIEGKIIELVEQKAASVAVILDCKKVQGSTDSWLNKVVKLLD